MRENCLILPGLGGVFLVGENEQLDLDLMRYADFIEECDICSTCLEPHEGGCVLCDCEDGWCLKYCESMNNGQCPGMNGDGDESGDDY